MDETYSSDLATTTNAIIASDLMDELIAIRDSFDVNYWRLGDITNIIISQAIAQGAENIKMVLYHRIGQIVGKSPKMIRYYSAVSGFYPHNIRERYHLLPFSHFSYAMRFRESDDVSFSSGSKCEEVLDYAQDNAEEFHGLPPSVASLKYEFEESDRLPESTAPRDRRAPQPSISVIDTFPISSNGDSRNRDDILESRKKTAVRRLSNLISEIVPIVQFLDNSVLSQLVSRLVENIRYYIEQYEDFVEDA